jgi:hypothetical protein
VLLDGVVDLATVGPVSLDPALEREFEERYFAWTPYLYDYPGGVDYAAEQAAIDAGAIRALGVRYVGARWTS